MTTLNPSKFIDQQEEVCLTTIEETPLPKICPTCIPNPNAIEIRWSQVEEPYLNEKTCEYTVRVNINNEGNSYDASEIRDSGKTIKQIIDSYKIAGIYQLLRFFDKEISNKIVFAFPDDPQKLARMLKNQNVTTEKLIEVVTTQVQNGSFSAYNIPEAVLQAYNLSNSDGFNPEGLELYARSDDYYMSNYQSPKGGEPIWVKVVIPAFIFDRVPAEVGLDDDDDDGSDTVSEIVLDGIRLKGQVRRLKHALEVYSKYQGMWWQTEKGKLVFQKDPVIGALKNSFYCKNYITKIDEVLIELEDLIESQTKFRLRRIMTPRSVVKIKLTFKKENENNPYYIKKLEVMGASCPDYEKISLNKLKKENGVSYKSPFNNSTVMGYYAQLNDIDSDLNSRETPPWLDFLVKYTYPELSIDYGTATAETTVTDGSSSILGCIVDNNGGTEGLRDFFFDQVISTFDAISYKWNQNSCKILAAGASASRGDQEALGKLQKDLSDENFNEKNPNLFAERQMQNTFNELDESIENMGQIIELMGIIEAEQVKIASFKEDVDYYINQILSKMQHFASTQAIERFEGRSIPEKPANARATADFYDVTELDDDIDELEKSIKEMDASQKIVDESHEQKVFLENSTAKERERALNKAERQETKDERAEKKAAVRSWESISDQFENIENKRDLRKEQRKQTREDNKYFRTKAKAKRRNKGKQRGEDPFVGAARDAVLKKFKFEESLIQIFLSEEEFAEFGLAGLSMPDLVKNKERGKKGKPKERLKGFLNDMGLCGFTKLMQKAIKCLMAGMSLDMSLRAIIQAAIANMAPAAMEKLLLGLDPRKQQEIKDYVAKTFRDMPAPWERDYNPGSSRTDQQLDNTQLSSIEDNVSSNSTKIEQKKKLVELYNGFVNFAPTFLAENASSGPSLPTGITLKVGDTGTNVKTLQQLIKNQFGSALDPNFGVDGKFGPMTKAAVEYTQATLGLEVTGIADAATIESINPISADVVGEALITNAVIASSSAADPGGDLFYGETELKTAFIGKPTGDIIVIAAKLTESLEKEIKALESSNSNASSGLGADQLNNWLNMSQEEQDQMIEDAQNEAGAVDISNPDQVNQGSIGTALGNVQAAVFDAYVEALLSLVQIQDLFAALDKIPGSKLIARIISSFDCPNVSFIYPPVKSFLSTLTFQRCLENGRFAFPRIPDFGNLKSLRKIVWGFLKETFLNALQNLWVGIITGIILKILLIIENALCKALEAVGRFAAEAVKGPEAQFSGLMRDFFCGPEASDDEIDDFTSSLLSSVGITDNELTDLAKTTTASDLKGKHLEMTKAIARISSTRELEQLFVANDGEQDINTLKRISNTISIKFPEFGSLFDTPSKVAGIFSSMGNFLTPDQREAVRSNLQRPGIDLPVDASICLTNDQYEDWKKKRKTILTVCGITPDEADEVIKKDDEDAEEDLYDVADTLAKGPEKILKDAIEKALFPDTGLKDPFCDDIAGSIAQMETPESAAQKDEFADGVFRALSVAFSKDMIGKKDALLDNILADTTNLPLKVHQRKTNNVVFQIDYANSQEDWDAKKSRFEQTKIGEFYFGILSNEEPVGVFPETVGILTKNKLDENDFDINFVYTTKTEPQNKTRSMDIGFLLKDVNVKYKRTYRKEPDLKLDFYNDKRDGIRIDSDLTLTSYEEGSVVIKKELGYRSFIYYYGTSYVPNPDDPDDDGKDMPYDQLQYKVTVGVPTDLSGGTLLQEFGDIREKKLQELKVPYQGTIFAKYINSVLSGAGHPALPLKQMSKDSYKSYLDYLYAGIIPGLNSKLDGSEPEGYNFGYEANNLTPDDLIYVNPEATSNESTWEYTYDEEEMVLGKSATENPRVHYLDPSIYGGKFNNPPMYIEPQGYSGWLGFAQTIVPEFDGCKPRRSDFIGLKDLSDNVRKLEKAIPMDSRLREDPDCLKHIPFDKISDSSTIAYLDTTMIATIRVYIAEAMVKTLPILGHMTYNNKNYDTGFEALIVERMQEGLSETEARLPIFGGRIQNFNYWLLFLEQAVQSVTRKIDLGEIETNSEIEDVRKVIDNAQRNFVYPSRDNLRFIKGTSEINIANALAPGGKIDALAQVMGNKISTINPAKINEEYAKKPAIRQILKGCYIAGYPALAQQGAMIDQEIDFDPLFLTLNAARFASKINTIYNVRKACKIMLKYLVKNQLNEMASNLYESLEPRPYIYDYYKYTLALSDVYNGTTLKSGISDTEAPIVDGEVNYGDIPNVGDVSPTEGFYLEKYIRIVNKPDSLAQSSSFWSADQLPERDDAAGTSAQQIVKQRPASLKGVCNINDFGAYFGASKDLFDDTTNISDIFGDAEIVSGSTGYIGSTGIKFGVRICMVPDPTMASLMNPAAIDPQVASQEKSFTMQSIPIASFEQDLTDIKFKELEFNDSNIGQDLKCYIDSLVKTEEFQFLMNYAFGINKIPSLMLMYTNEAFIEAIGADIERDIDNTVDRFDDEWKGEILSDSKRICRQLFASFYRSDDFEVAESDDGRTLAEIIGQMKEGSIFGKTDPSMKWWRRRRLRGRPYDKDGKECAGEFASLFKN